MLHPENTVNGLRNDEKNEGSGFGYQLLGGIDYALTARWALFAEAKYTRGTAEVEVGGGRTAQARLATTHLVFGLSYAF